MISISCHGAKDFYEACLRPEVCDLTTAPADLKTELMFERVVVFVSYFDDSLPF